tara:strand:- start:299 stop:718 length:420 start_codon:yes stop_codon:yes gene_type:complete
MSRPIYENESTLQAEKEFAQYAQQKLLCFLVKCPRSFKIDFAATRKNQVVSFIEYRKRTNDFNEYPTFMIAASKKIAAQAINKASGLPVYLFVKWADHLGYTDLTNCKSSWNVGGRTDRNDPADFEPVIHIDLSEFKTI